MEKFKRYLENKNKEKIQEINSILNLKNSASIKVLMQNYLTLPGFNNILSQLNSHELKVLSAIFDTKGLTYNELHKETSLPVKDIESASAKLEKLNLVYILKDRKHLNNKLDKIILFQPINDMLRPFKNVSSDKIIQTINETNPVSIKKTSFPEIVDEIYYSGGLSTLNHLNDKFSKEVTAKFIDKYLEKGHIEIYHRLETKFETIIVLLIQPKSVIEETNYSINNSFYALNNIFFAYDVISTHGLYLTQQNKLRKVDKRRITEHLLPVKDIDGKDLEERDNLKLTLHLLDKINAIFLHKDYYYIDQKVLNEFNFKPYNMLKALLKKSTEEDSDIFFEYPFYSPDKYELSTIKNIFSNDETIPMNVFKSKYLANRLISNTNLLNNFTVEIENLSTNFMELIKTFILMGILSKNKEGISISALGKRFLFNESTEFNDKSVYINPDHTLLIPQNEIPPKSLFILMNYTDIIKNDILIESRISSESIIRAKKREMNVDHFLKILAQHSKNEIPQNLKFVIKEWINSIVEVNISYATVINVNDKEFLDKIERTNQSAIITRINENYAIVSREHLDDIIKHSEKDNTLIRLDSEFRDY